jgi:hypothetical protein
LGRDVFYDTHSTLSIKVPASKVAEYQSAWSTYSAIIEAGAPPAP